MPRFYHGSKTCAPVPEYLKLRFDEKTRAFNAIAFAIMTVAPPPGIATPRLRHPRWVLLLEAGTVKPVSRSAPASILVYVLLGRPLTCASYNEVLQFFLDGGGLLPSGSYSPCDALAVGACYSKSWLPSQSRKASRPAPGRTAGIISRL